MSDDRHNPEPELDAPKRLADALAALRNERVFVPPAVDDAVLGAVRRHFAHRQQSARRGRVLWGAGVAAAALVIGAMLLREMFWPGAAREQLVTRERFEHGAPVDILDAFALARHIEAGSAPRECDLNGDGVVDRCDVDVLAARAVQLSPGGGE